MEMRKGDLGALEQFLGSRSILTPVLPGLLGISEKKIVNGGYRKMQHQE